MAQFLLLVVPKVQGSRTFLSSLVYSNIRNHAPKLQTVSKMILVLGFQNYDTKAGRILPICTTINGCIDTYSKGAVVPLTKNE